MYPAVGSANAAKIPSVVFRHVKKLHFTCSPLLFPNCLFDVSRFINRGLLVRRRTVSVGFDLLY